MVHTFGAIAKKNGALENELFEFVGYAGYAGYASYC